jgi:hypothetical protein
MIPQISGRSPVLLQQRAAQHGFRWQATPAGLANPVAA